jgi:hypothetical protein
MIICTVPLVSEFAVHCTVALTVVLAFWVTGFGNALAETANVGGTIGVAATGAEFGPVPIELVPETT